MRNDPATFVGSCPALLKELETIRHLSTLDLDPVPQGYEEMRKDFATFCGEVDLKLDDADTVRWIWHALYDGAQIAMDTKSILWAGP
jgi:hypothetical protein